MTGQHFVSVYEKNGAFKARTVLRVPNVQKWSEESVAVFSATPFQLHAAKTCGAVFQEKPAAEEAYAAGKTGRTEDHA